MELLSPRRAARAFGVSESSLKRWCDDGLIPTVRTAGGHRRLAAPDLLHFARQQGRPLVAPSMLGLPHVRRNSAAGLQDARPQFVDALLAGDESRARQIVVDLYLAKHSPAVICDELIARAFQDIGDRWACREADVYQERRGCEIVLRVLYELRRLQPRDSGRPTALCATIEGDHYLLPPAMAETVLHAAGYEAMPLGNNIPLGSLANAVRQLRPRVLCLSVSSIADEAELIAGVNHLAKTCEEQGTALVVGGRALTAGLRTKLTYAAYCDTMQQLASLAGVLIGRKRRSSRSQNRRRGEARG